MTTGPIRQDPDAKITKMKDGRTRFAHKAKHAVDLETGAVIGVTVQDADAGDRTTLVETLITAAEQVEAVLPAGDDSPKWWATRRITAMRHSSRWPTWNCAATYPSRTAGDAGGGGRLRPVPPCTPTGAGYGVPVGRACSAKRASASNASMPISTKPGDCAACICGVTPKISSAPCGLNLGLLMRRLTGVGTPRSLHGRVWALIDAQTDAFSRFCSSSDPPWTDYSARGYQPVFLTLQEGVSATAC